MESVGKVAGIPYTLSRLKRCKNITVRVLGNGEVRVSAPLREPIRSVERVILAHKQKLLKSIEQQKKEHQIHGHTWEDGDTFLFGGEQYTLRIQLGAKDSFYVEEGAMLLTYKQEHPSKEEISSILKKYYRTSAQKRIAPLVADWALKLELTPPVFTVRDSKKRWGSCSSQGRLNFSLRAACLSEEDLSYLVLHEMAHLIYFNHGPLFRSYLSEHMPTWQKNQQNIFKLQRRADLTP